MIPKTIRTWK